MLHHSLLYSLIRRSKIILLAGLGAGILSLFAGLLFPLEYRADAQALIIPQSRYGVDPYTVVKSAERVGENIVAIMKTDDFYQKVVTQSGPALDTSRFAGVSERVKRKRWQRAVRASVVYGTGIVNISAYHAKPDEAKALAAACKTAFGKIDASLKVGHDKASSPAAPAATGTTGAPAITLDLLGVACPMNYVKTKLQLEEMEPLQILEVLLDAGEPAENVPRSVKSDGYRVMSLAEEAGHYRLVIENKAE